MTSGQLRGLMPVSLADGHPGLGLHLPEGEGQGGQEAQAGRGGGHQVIRDPGVIIITQVASEMFLIICTLYIMLNVAKYSSRSFRDFLNHRTLYY